MLCIGLCHADLSPLFAGADHGRALAGLLAVLVTILFGSVGFDTNPQCAEGASTSARPHALALLIVASIRAAIVFYVLLISSVSMLGSWQKLPAAHAFEAAFRAPWLRDLVLVAVLLGQLTRWSGFFLAGSRVVFALGRARIFAGSFGQTHKRHGTPHRAILLIGGMTAFAPMTGRDALLAPVNAGSFCIALIFVGVSVSLLRLRRDYPDDPRLFRLKGAWLIAGIAAFDSLSMLIAMIVPGSPALASRIFQSQREAEIKRASLILDR